MIKPALLALTAAAPAALAGNVQTQTLDFAWTMDAPLQIGSLNGFDTAGGTRVLTGVSFSIDAATEWDVTAANYTDTAFEPGEWWAEGIANFNVLFGEFGPAGVERITGAIEFSGLTGSLSAGSGGPFGDPGEVTVSAQYDGFLSNGFDLDASEFAAFTAAQVDVFLPVFTDAYIDGPNGAPGFINIGTDALAATGSITLNYTYDIVPAPGAAALLGLAGLTATRRRRN